MTPPTREQILTRISASPAGLTLSELLMCLPGLARRTAQRHLSELVSAGQLAASGQGRARRYLSIAANTRTDPGIIPLSADSHDIVAYVSRPLAGRTPISYQREFLDDYRPNQTWYLPASMRRQLHRLGQTDAIDQPAGTYSRAVLGRLLIDLSWASSHLEGNTYSRLDTVALLEHGQVAAGKDLSETQMILNHKSAIELIVQNIDTAGFDRFTLMNLHSALAENLLANPADEGRIRQHAVDIAGSVYRPLALPDQLEALLDVMLHKAKQIDDPFEQSFFMMVHLPYLQPFADINKRTSRLAANLPLFRANLCPLTFLAVPEAVYTRAILGVYEMTRVELLRDVYVWAYERSAQEYLAIRRDLAEPDPLRQAWRSLTRQVINQVVSHPEQDPLTVIKELVAAQVPVAERADVKAMIVEELRRLHEGVLARYGLRPSQLEAWRLVNGN